MEVEFQSPWRLAEYTITDIGGGITARCWCGWGLSAHPAFVHRQQTYHDHAHERGEYQNKWR